MTPTPERLCELIIYDSSTGLLTWRERSEADIPCKAARNGWNSRFGGRDAFSYNTPRGYLSGGVLDRKLLAHRVAWAIYYGVWPSKNIDHINGIKTDNRISNLRDVSQVENARNSKLRTNNKSGVAGVHWCNKAQKWRARLNEDGKTKEIGTFSDFDQAVAARYAAKALAGYAKTYEGL